MAEAALIVLFSIVSFVGGTRFGVWLAEHEMKISLPVSSPPATNKAHMLPVENRRLEAMMKYAQRRALRKNR